MPVTISFSAASASLKIMASTWAHGFNSSAPLGACRAASAWCRCRDPAQEIVHQGVQSRRGSSDPMCRPPLDAGHRGALCLDGQSVPHSRYRRRKLVGLNHQRTKG
jgi:hypothetical protein